jgi:long-chain fatty acid transport protein
MPFGLRTDWGQDSPFNAYATKTRLIYIKVHPVIAWQVTDTLSVAGGPSFDRTDLELNRAFAPMPGASLGEMTFDGDDSTVGYSLAARWQPSERHAFGISYQAKTTATYSGTTSTPFGPSEPSSFRLVFPESIVAGYSFRPTPQWNLEVNVDWTNWDRVKTPVLRNAVSPDVPLPLDWESSFIWSAGATRYFDNGYRVSAGYTYVENSVPDRTFNPAVPDSDRHFIGLGVGRQYDTFTWQITYQFTIAPSRTVSGSNPAGPTDLSGTQTADGRYRNESQAIAFSLSARF